jgi:hypothetical protein
MFQKSGSRKRRRISLVADEGLKRRVKCRDVKGIDGSQGASLSRETDPGTVTLDVRSVLFGSYVASPTDPVRVNAKNISFSVPAFQTTTTTTASTGDAPRNVAIQLDVRNFGSVWAFWGAGGGPDAEDGALIIYLSRETAENVWCSLKVIRSETDAGRSHFLKG